jgi:predicted GNAT family acetyltransferase
LLKVKPQEFDYLFTANLNAERAYQEIGFKTRPSRAALIS